MARCIWALENEVLVEAICGVTETDAKAWLAAIFKILPQADSVRVAVVLWAIWYVRRKAIHENEFQSPLSTHCFVDRFIADLGQEKPRSASTLCIPHRSPAWIAPPAGMVKINVDAALSKNDLKASAAAIARDETGRFLGASALVLRGISDPEVMESIACREGMSLALDIQVANFRLASDNQNVVKNIRQGSRGVYGQIVQEINARRSAFASVEFVHEKRDSNVDAHNIARSAIYDDLGQHVWLLSPPYGVYNSYTSSD
jgi:ribonuclease HI